LSCATNLNIMHIFVQETEKTMDGIIHYRIRFVSYTLSHYYIKKTNDMHNFLN